MDYTMRKVKKPLETYRIMPHTVDGVTFYILEIDSWCHACVLIMNSKEDAEQLAKRDKEYTHLTKTDSWNCIKLVKLMIDALDNPAKHHIASRLSDRHTFFNMLDIVM